jgi:ubiquinone/menaquinone biosynthesis C-methylase UbiE
VPWRPSDCAGNSFPAFAPLSAGFDEIHRQWQQYANYPGIDLHKGLGIRFETRAMATATAQESKSGTYALGYGKGTTRTFDGRTAANSARFLIDHLEPHMRILDIGCGPGSITCGLAELVPEGSVLGVDISPTVLEQAKANVATKDLQNISFQTGNVLQGLPFPDHSFDVVFTHQCLVHLSDPVKAMREMKRLCRKRGIVASREGDAHIWYPRSDVLEGFIELTAEIMRQTGVHEPAAGRHLHVWARQAGFKLDEIENSVSGTCTASPEKREKFRMFVHDQLGEKSMMRIGALRMGKTKEQLDEILRAVDEWAANEDGWVSMMCGEVICRNT